MKIISNYLKEMKIATSGFYFYIELVVALIIMLTLVLVVPIESNHVVKEVIFMNVDAVKFEELMDQKVGKAYNERVEDYTFKLKPATLTYTDENGQEIVKVFTDKKQIVAKCYETYDSLTGKHNKTKYFVDNFDDMLRIAYQKKYIATEAWYEGDLDYYNNILFGYETNKYQNVVKLGHGTLDTKIIYQEMQNNSNNQITLVNKDTLNNREAYVPLLLVLVNGLLGMLVITSYISVDRKEKTLEALKVTPLKVNSYLISKILVSLTTIIISSLIIVFPIFLFKVNYILVLLTILSMSLVTAMLGLIVGSYFKDVKDSFGAYMILALSLVLPVLNQLVPSFNPNWIKLIPTYYMLESMKEALLVNPDFIFIVMSDLVMLLVSIVLFAFANKRYKKVLV